MLAITLRHFRSGIVELSMKETQTRLWWMEVIRGVLSITFGLLFIFIDVRFFIYALGIYLIFDGNLDIYKVATGKRAPERKVLSSLGSALSIVLGLISLVYHVLTIFLLLIIIAARIIISSARAMIEAWRSRSPYAGVIWLYGGLLGLLGLILFLFPVHTLFFTRIFLRNFIIVYALCDGFYLVVRGLLLRFAPAISTRSTFQAPEKSAGGTLRSSSYYQACNSLRASNGSNRAGPYRMGLRVVQRLV